MASFAVVGAALSALGWVLNEPRLTDWLKTGINIKANTAVCVFAAGGGLLIAVLAPERKLAVRLLGTLVALVAALTLAEHLTNLNFGIDTLLVSEPAGAAATTAPGRMGMPASTSITAIGLALIFTTGSRRLRGWAAIFGTAALGVAALSLVGYLFGADQLYTIPRWTGIALQTALMIAAMAVGLIAAVPENAFLAAAGRRDAGGLMLRRLILPVIATSLILGWLRILAQHAGLVDIEFGAAARTLVEIVLLLSLLWWTAKGISKADDRALDARLALAERDQRLRDVLETLSDSFMSLDAGMRITETNAAFRRTWTEDRNVEADFIGKGFFEVFPAARDTNFGATLLQAAADRLPATVEERLQPFNRWFAIRLFPIADGGVSMFSQDITDRKRSEEMEARRAAELDAMYGFTDMLQRAKTMGDVYEAALNAIAAVTGCARASILLFDDEGVMGFVAARGLSAEYQTAVTGHSPWKQGEAAARPIGIEDIKTADIDNELRSVITGEGIRALGFIPLITNETLIGKFMVYYDEPHVFPETEFELCMTVAYQIAFGVERKRTEETLRENEERLRLATQTGKVGVWDWDIPANHVSWTESVYKMHGLAVGEFDGLAESFAALVHPDDREWVSRRIDQALSGEMPYEIECRVIRPDGGVNWLYTSAVVLRSGVEPARMIGATVDITKLKQAELESAKLAAIVRSSRDAIVSKDLNGIVTSWNEGAQHVFGYSPDEIIGKPITTLIPEDRLNEESDILSRIGRGESIDHYETVRIRKDGSSFDASLTISPLVDANGKVIGASKIARDITERKQAATAIRESEIMHRLVDAQEAERHRIARDLHDHLGQQLTALRLKIESARTKSDGNTALLEELDQIQQYAARIDLDINYLAWELRPTELDNLGLHDALASFVREWSTTYGIAAEFHTSTKTPQRLHPELETNLYRIVQESLNNILKHAEASRVNVLLETNPERVVLIIEDDGNGFDFGSAPTNGHKSKGLGLIGMRERTALLGGTLEIESRPGEGTTIYARVPTRAVDMNGNGSEESEVPVTSA